MIEIDLTHQAGEWPESAHLTIKDALAVCFSQLELLQNGDVSVVLADDDFIQELNKKFRQKDKPTNVLSFPQDEDLMAGDNAHTSYGDIILALQTITQEADDQGKTFDEHLQHLVIHGFLHLLGYDHEDDTEAEEMENLEIELLQKLGVKNPYAISENMA